MRPQLTIFRQGTYTCWFTFLLFKYLKLVCLREKFKNFSRDRARLQLVLFVNCSLPSLSSKGLPSSSTYTLEDSAIYLTSEQSTLETENDNASVLDVYLVSCQTVSDGLFSVIPLTDSQQGTFINAELKEPEDHWGIS